MFNCYLAHKSFAWFVTAAQKPTVEDPEEKAMKKRSEDWMTKYGPTYKDKEEKAMRYEHNATPGTLCTLGTNQFATEPRSSVRVVGLFVF